MTIGLLKYSTLYFQLKSMVTEIQGKLSVLNGLAIILLSITVVSSLTVSGITNVYAWSTHMTFKNNTPFPLKFQVEAAEGCTAQPNATCTAGAEYIWYNTYICPGVYPFDDNGTLTESKCSLAAYEFFKYVEPVLIKALNIIDNALEQAEEDGDEDEVAEMTSMQKVGGIQTDMSKGYYVLSWKEGVYGDKTITANLDPTTGKFSLSD